MIWLQVRVLRYEQQNEAIELFTRQNKMTPKKTPLQRCNGMRLAIKKNIECLIKHDFGWWKLAHMKGDFNAVSTFRWVEQNYRKLHRYSSFHDGNEKSKGRII